MMGDLFAASSSDHARLARVLAGDPGSCWVLALARNLPDAELDALTLRAEQMGVEAPADTAVTMRQEQGLAPG